MHTQTLTAWPGIEQAELDRFYGRMSLGDDGRPSAQWESTFLIQISTPFPLRLSWHPEERIRKITCHREVAPSLHRIFGAMWNRMEEVQTGGYDLFTACYSWRTLCAKHALSLHGYGAAIQLGPIRQPKKPLTDADTLVDDIFTAEGWSYLGATEGWGAVKI